MSYYFGRNIRQRRIEKGLTNGQLAARLGYRNISKGANRLDRLEKDEYFCPELLRKVVEALEIDKREVNAWLSAYYTAQQEEYDRWADQPIAPYLIRRFMPSIYVSIEIPEAVRREATREALESFAAERAREWKSKVCLVLSRRQTSWINQQGEVYFRKVNTFDDHFMPFMSLKGGGGSRGFLFSGGLS